MKLYIIHVGMDAHAGRRDSSTKYKIPIHRDRELVVGRPINSARAAAAAAAAAFFAVHIGRFALYDRPGLTSAK